jgi:hypothetical protein
MTPFARQLWPFAIRAAKSGVFSIEDGEIEPMAFGEMNAKNLAKSLLNLHRKEDNFEVRFATMGQAQAVSDELILIGCEVQLDEEKFVIQVKKPVRAEAEVS